MATKRKSARRTKKAAPKRTARRRTAKRPPTRTAKRNGARRPSRRQTARDTSTMVEQAFDTAVQKSRKAARKVKQGLSELFSG